MTDDRSLERAARSWLEMGPTEAPPHAVDAALLRIRTTPQERDWKVPRRAIPMSAPARLSAAAVLAVLLVGGVLLIAQPGSGVGGPSATPSGSASPSAAAAVPSGLTPPDLNLQYTSQRYGFSVRVPSQWTLTRATRQWAPGGLSSWGSGYSDEFAGPTARFSGEAQNLRSDETPDAWLRDYAGKDPVHALAGYSSDPNTWPMVDIGGVPGRLTTDGQPSTLGLVSGAVSYDAVVVVDSRGYNFSLDGLVDRPTFEAFLASVTFPDIPAPDTTFTSPLDAFTVRFPHGWAVTPATTVWKVDDYGNFAPALSDVLGDREFMGSSTLVARGETFEHWFAAYDAARRAGTCGAAAQEEPVLIDGLPGLLDLHCPSSYVEAVVHEGDRVWVFTTWHPESMALFSTMLDSVKLPRRP